MIEVTAFALINSTEAVNTDRDDQLPMSCSGEVSSIGLDKYGVIEDLGHVMGSTSTTSTIVAI